jgi:hypothetical protein
MLGRRDNYMRMGTDGFTFYAKVLRRAPHQSDVDLVFAQQRNNVSPIADRKPKIDFRVLLHERCDEPGGKIFCCRPNANPNPPSHHSICTLKRFDEVSDDIVDTSGCGNYLLAGLRQPQTVPETFEQLKPKVLLKQFDPGSQSRWRYAEGFCGFNHGATPAHLADRFQLPERQIMHRPGSKFF